jgi:hypothetical protein
MAFATLRASGALATVAPHGEPSMAPITSISLANLKTYEHWKSAPLGALLQARDTNTLAAIVGMRCAMKMGPGQPQTQCVLVLEGEKRGELMEDGAIRGSVLDISDLIEIRVGELSPVPFSNDPHAQMLGIVCEFEPGSGVFLIRAKNRGKIRGWVLLADPTGRDPIGTVETGAVALDKLLVIGQVETGEKLSAPKAQAGYKIALSEAT